VAVVGANIRPFGYIFFARPRSWKSPPRPRDTSVSFRRPSPRAGGQESEDLERGDKVGDAPEAPLALAGRARDDRRTDPTPALRTYTRLPILIASIRIARGAPAMSATASSTPVECRTRARSGCRCRWNDAKRDRAAVETVEGAGDGAVTSRNHHQIELVAQAGVDDFARLVFLELLVNFEFDAGRREMAVKRLAHRIVVSPSPHPAAQ